MFGRFFNTNPALESSAESVDVIIIGAGISGLKAAIDLNKLGISTLILEARNRLGGRLHTVNLNDVPIDLGASWFHDCLVNELLDKNVENPNVTFYFDDGKRDILTSEGYLGSDSENLQPIMEEILTYIKLKYEKNEILKDDSIHNLYAPQIVRFIELWFGSSWDQSSGFEVGGLEHNGRNAFLTSGYYSVYENELKEYPIERILKNKVANKIQRFKKTISVTTTDNSTYSCKYLIVTVPQSVLRLPLGQEGALEWSPPMPSYITNTLPKMSFAALGKVVFEFDEIFWPKNSDRFFCLGKPDQNAIDAINSNQKPARVPIMPEDFIFQEPPKSWDYPVLFINFAKMRNKPILVGLMQSPVTNYIESLKSENDIWEYFRPYITKVAKFENESSVPWTVDPFARGSYTGAKVGGDYKNGVECLIKGLPNVRFAGEHTVFEGNGCAHGAYESGKREAKYIAEKMGKFTENKTKL
ncbi:hypothetical protein PACTADRAFT_4569 [Pachysolen tannophilus NRRL Y-2460]|uniref:Amine oxidase n=1 Tax=Pachysolen tannophilus NRRL Y-2460 TaxID=669874 RepID=A0A1E4TPH5_PACTA|nr:hypothetical protein PACTADRAFT_4569 [Pachysolen tannophilus NRRL Y-2460]